MSEAEMNSYRLTSMEEPGDERLAQIMREVRKLPVRREKNVTSLEILWSPTILLFHPKLCVFLLQFRAYSAILILIDTKCNQ